MKVTACARPFGMVTAAEAAGGQVFGAVGSVGVAVPVGDLRQAGNAVRGQPLEPAGHLHHRQV